MITAVDTNVILDVFTADPEFGARSRSALRRCLAEGRVVLCDVVLAEAASLFPSNEGVEEILSSTGIEFDATRRATAVAAGRAWSSYRRRGGSRTRVIADFLIGAHAESQADRLLTRDRGFYRSYFANLSLVDPSG